MHTETLKRASLVLTLWLALYTNILKAQIFTAPLQASTTGTNPVDFEFRADGTMVAKGNYGVGSLLTSDQGSGTRMLWFPSKGAFRAGGVAGAEWNSSNIGQYSMALGNDTTASGYASTALGLGSVASGPGSIALASGTASGYYSVAFGDGAFASGINSMAFAGGTATGDNSVSLGGTASGGSSTAFGNSTASGNAAAAFGLGTTASGYYSTSSGYYTIAQALDSFAMGAFNVGAGNPTTWVSTDPIFEIGNGTDASHPHDALLVDKSGNVTAGGVMRCSPGGDIAMGAFTAGTHP